MASPSAALPRVGCSGLSVSWVIFVNVTFNKASSIFPVEVFWKTLKPSNQFLIVAPFPSGTTNSLIVSVS